MGGPKLVARWELPNLWLMSEKRAVLWRLSNFCRKSFKQQQKTNTKTTNNRKIKTNNSLGAPCLKKMDLEQYILLGNGVREEQIKAEGGKCQNKCKEKSTVMLKTQPLCTSAESNLGDKRFGSSRKEQLYCFGRQRGTGWVTALEHCVSLPGRIW